VRDLAGVVTAKPVLQVVRAACVEVLFLAEALKNVDISSE
jgi:hypothetical protein